MTDLTTAATTPVKDFSRQRKPLVFSIDDDTFEAAPAIPGEILVEFAGLYEGATSARGVAETYRLLAKVLELVLLPDSHTRMQQRLSDRARPVELAQVSSVVEWLLEAYGLRPTQLPSSSSGGEPAPPPGTSSTASTVPAGSTFSPSPLPAS